MIKGGQMDIFEYKVIELKGIRHEDEDVLDGNGKQGWELVTVIRGTIPKRLMFLGYLKKPAE